MAFLDTLKEKYTELAIEKFVAEFSTLVENDKLVPLVVSENDDYLRLIVSNRLDVPLNSREDDDNNGNNNNNKINNNNTSIPNSMNASTGLPTIPLVTSNSKKKIEEEIPDVCFFLFSPL